MGIKQGRELEQSWRMRMNIICIEGGKGGETRGEKRKKERKEKRREGLDI